MQQLLRSYAAYNLWANKTLTDKALELPKEKLLLPVDNTLENIYGIVHHLWYAESVWWQRMNLISPVIAPEINNELSFDELCKNLLTQSRTITEWTEKIKPAMFTHEVIYQNTKNEQFKQYVWQMLLQIFNHATHHRAQLIPLLKSGGIKNIPVTDYIFWSRKKQSVKI